MVYGTVIDVNAIKKDEIKKATITETWLLERVIWMAGAMKTPLLPTIDVNCKAITLICEGNTSVFQI